MPSVCGYDFTVYMCTKENLNGGGNTSTVTTRKKLVPVCWTFILSKYESKSFNTKSCYSLDEC